MAGENCTYVPNALGTDKPSKLYKDFVGKVGGDRPFTNYIYALYSQDGVAEAMDSAGYKRDKNGEHKADDVYKFFNVADMRSEAGVSINSMARTIGVMDSSGNYIDFDATTAYRKAQDFNNNSKGGKVAFVQQHGDKFNVVLVNSDSRTFMHKADVELQSLKWQTVDTAFGNNGISLSDIARKFPAMANPTRTDAFLYYLKSLAEVSNVKYLSKKDIDVILNVASAYPKVQTLMGRGWGNTTETAEQVFDVLHNPSKYDASLVGFVTNAIDEARRVNSSLVESLQKELKDSVEPSFNSASKEFDIKKTLKELDEKYGIDTEIIVLHDKEIKSLSQAAAHSMVTLQRQIEKLKREGVDKKPTNRAQVNEMYKTLNQISRELEGKRYYAGLITFVGKSLDYAERIRTELASIPSTGTRMEYAARRAEVLAKAKNMQDSYAYILRALTNLDNLVIDENISDADKQTLKTQAEEVLKILDKQEGVMNSLREDTMIDLCTEVFGDNVVEGRAVADIVRMTEADCSIMDWLYSVGRQSNPLIGSMGTIIRDAQLERDKILNAYSYKIRQATNALYKSGHRNTEFMYEFSEDSGYYRVASDINFDAYEKDRNKEYAKLSKKYKGFQLRDAMDAWVYDHTEVDGKYSSTARVPKRSEYGRTDDFQAGWDSAQKEYYNTIMTIKGEIEDLLPKYAQNLYLPPQRRASWLDIVKKGIDGKMTLKEVTKNLLDRMNPIKVRANETDYGMFVDGRNYVESQGDYDGTLLREIPVYNTRRLRDQNDLLLDFSGAVQSLAQTAINYDMMYRIKDIVELMGDYIKSRPSTAKKNDMTRAEVVETQAIHVLSTVKNHAKAFGIEQLIDGFIDKHIYGVEMKSQGAGWRAVQALVNYTSLNQLAPNLKGGISNYLVGEHQMLIEAVAGSMRSIADSEGVMYTLKDYVEANALVFGTKVQRGNLMDHLTNDVNSTAHLLAERFDPLQDIAQEQGGQRYYNSIFRQMIGGFDIMGLYSSGEAAIHYTNMYAVLLHEKVLDNKGNKVSLYSAFKPYGKRTKKNGNAELEIKDGYTQLDGSAIDEAYLDKVKDNIRYINQKTHGSMNKEDKGLIHQHMAGRAVMNFRQWMVEHYSRRYRGRHWDASQRQFVEGYFNTVYKVAKSYISDYVGFVNDANAHWDQLDTAQKENVWRACAEVSLLACLYALSHALGEPDDHKGEFWYRMWIYQVRRLILDEEASVPPIPGMTGGFVSEGVTILDSPIASVKTLNGILYPITGLHDINDTIQSGRYEGWNKYARNLLKSAPFYNQIDQLMHMDEESYVFSVFDR